MKKDQLFKKYPTEELFNKIIQSFGLQNLNDTRSFSRKDLKILKTIENIEKLKTELYECYLPCKSRTYLNELNEKNIVTVLRQILKTKNYTINSREKYMRGEKFIIYSLCPLEKKKYNPVLNNLNDISDNINEIYKKPILLTFD
tara:strand:+ start:9658 stop:10089 length:432 start_codon:yes stop_codon:yes gene_type:complete